MFTKPIPELSQTCIVNTNHTIYLKNINVIKPTIKLREHLMRQIVQITKDNFHFIFFIKTTLQYVVCINNTPLHRLK